MRRTANLHTGGTIEDVTDRLHPDVAEAAVRAATALGIPVTGLDFLVPDVDGPDYVFIEANERPGLANHEPQPIVERFVDLLFPETRAPLTAHCPGDLRAGRPGRRAGRAGPVGGRARRSPTPPAAGRGRPCWSTSPAAC